MRTERDNRPDVDRLWGRQDVRTVDSRADRELVAELQARCAALQEALAETRALLAQASAMLAEMQA